MRLKFKNLHKKHNEKIDQVKEGRRSSHHNLEIENK